MNINTNTKEKEKTSSFLFKNKKDENYKKSFKNNRSQSPIIKSVKSSIKPS